MTYLITLILAYCSIVYELLLAQTLSGLMGNTVLRYSITIGVYLASLGIGAMLCKKGDEPDCARRLIRIEIWLSVIGGTAVLTLCSLDVLNRFLMTAGSFFSYGFGSTLRPVLFFVLSHGMIAAIGILSGFEIPLLMALKEFRTPDRMNFVLGINYFGALLGAVMFPLALLPLFGLFSVSYTTGLLNAFACVLLLICKPAAGKSRYVKMTAAVSVTLLLLFAFAGNTQHFFLKKFYYYRDVKSLSSLFDSFESYPAVEEYRSRYQHIHIVNQPVTDTQQVVYKQYSDKFTREPAFPKSMWLFLNHKYQFLTSTEEFYHEFFVHVPIQLARPPGQVLVLGAGDGLVVRELLKYKEIKHITLVELDPKMLHMAQHHPLFQAVNHDSFADPKVTLVQQDAFSWLQSSKQHFDAVYIDFPDPTTYDLAKLYSVEFYSLVKHAVSDAGYVAADLPAGEGLLWDEYYSTLRAAGFEFIKPFDSILEADNPGVSELKKQFLSRAAAQKTNPQGYPVTTRDPEFLEQAFAKLIRDNLRELQHRFVFLQSKKQPVNTRFRDDGIVLYTLNATRFKLASEVKFDATFKPGRINSIFRPTMPLQSFFDLNFPY